jgi:RNA polymerase sigma-70 factor (ECF subfamily)
VSSRDDDDGDEALMLAYRDGGDDGAFERLYRRHKGGLYRFLLRQCGSRAVAEELFQDVWLNIIRSRSAYSVDARFATYLYRIAHNRRSVHRPSLAIAEDETDPVELIPAAAHDQPELRAQSREQVERLQRLLGELPAVQREAFVLHAEAGLGVAEIASVTGVNHETAKSRLRYAVAKLKRGMLDLI